MRSLPPPRRAAARALFLAVLAGSTLPACAALQQVAALRQVEFAFDRITDVRVAGVATAGRDDFRDLRVDEVGRIALAIANRDVPVEFTVHVRAENPSTNDVTARLLELGWTMFLDDRQVVEGELDRVHVFEPGRVVDVPVPVRFDAYDLYEHNAQDLYELGLAIAGVSGYRKEIRLDLEPTVETDWGPIRYPRPITVRRTEGS
jgi:hypothetical protein